MRELIKSDSGFYLGLFIGFSVTLLITGFIMVTEFTGNKFLKLNKIYLDGKYYKLVEHQESCGKRQTQGLQ